MAQQEIAPCNLGRIAKFRAYLQHLEARTIPFWKNRNVASLVAYYEAEADWFRAEIEKMKSDQR